MAWKVAQRLLRGGRQLVRTLQTDGLIAAVRKAHVHIRKHKVEDLFDQQYGVETATHVSLFELDIRGSNESVGVRYQPSPVEVCDQVFSWLPIGHEHFTFIDLGAGKGRVLLVASRFPFKRIIGVEFATELVETARLNVERFGCKAEVVHSDAAEYQFPSDNLVVYLYNPFGPEVLRTVLSSLHEVSHTHEVYLLYLNAKHSACVEEFASEMHAISDVKIYHFDKLKI